MSHSVTIRTQTVTASSSTIIINTGYLKSWSGILKFLQLALGIVCVGIIGNEFNTYPLWTTAECFFLVITITFMINTFILLLSCLMSLSTASIISKTIYELLYHSIAFGLLFAASLTLLVHVNNYRRYNYELLLGASVYLVKLMINFKTSRSVWHGALLNSKLIIDVIDIIAICGLVNAGLYLFSTILALRTYRGF